MVDEVKPELKACPFCGGEAALKANNLDERFSYGREAWVECIKCGARTAKFYHDDAKGYAVRETADPKAIAAWNHRAPTPSGDLVERVARAICAVNEPDPDEEMLPGTPCWVALIPEARAALSVIPNDEVKHGR